VDVMQGGRRWGKCEKEKKRKKKRKWRKKKVENGKKTLVIGT
jgi:hypothetical protein